jgi:tetratricopeptide (TPR) repeat protein
MAECYRALGGPRYQEAEEALLLLVENNKVVTPQAPEFKAALFALSELYAEQGAYEKAIRRLEEVLARYPEEGRAVRSRFLLADAYRKSAHALAELAADPKDAIDHNYLTRECKRRLERSIELFEEAASLYQERSGTLSSLEEVYVEQSHLYRADGLFELGRDEEALQAYQDVASLYSNSPAYLAANTQIMRIHLRAGRIPEARAALWNARTRLGVIPKSGFQNRSGQRARRRWKFYLDHLVRLHPFVEEPRQGQASSTEEDANELRAKKAGV